MTSVLLSGIYIYTTVWWNGIPQRFWKHSSCWSLPVPAVALSEMKASSNDVFEVSAAFFSSENLKNGLFVFFWQRRKWPFTGQRKFVPSLWAFANHFFHVKSTLIPAKKFFVSQVVWSLKFSNSVVPEDVKWLSVQTERHFFIERPPEEEKILFRLFRTLISYRMWGISLEKIHELSLSWVNTWKCQTSHCRLVCFFSFTGKRGVRIEVVVLSVFPFHLHLAPNSTLSFLQTQVSNRRLNVENISFSLFGMLQSNSKEWLFSATSFLGEI